MAFDIAQLPQDAIEKLKNILRFGKGGASTQGQPSGATGNVPINPDQNPDYQREPGGLLKRGAASAPQPATPPSPTDVTDPNKQPAPTITPVTPQGSGQQPQPIGSATPPKVPLTDAQWAQQNPGATPAPPTPFQAPGWKSRLAHTLMYGALEGVKPAIAYNENIGTQQRKSQQDIANYPQTLHGAREKEEAAQAGLAKTQAETANFQSEAQHRNAEVPAIEQQLAKAVQEKNEPEIQRITAVKAGQWKAEHPDDQTPKDAFQLYLKGHPQATYEQYQQEQAANAEKLKQSEQVPKEPKLEELPLNGAMHKVELAPDGKTIVKDWGAIPTTAKADTETKSKVLAIYKPAMDADIRLQLMEKSEANALKGDQQAMVNLLANHVALVLGMPRGRVPRVSHEMFNEAAQSAPWLQKTEARFDKEGYLSGIVLTADQMKNIINLAHETREAEWQSANSQADYLGVEERPKSTYGQQAPPAAAPHAAGPALSNFHVNPQTHERIGWDGTTWVPAPAQ